MLRLNENELAELIIKFLYLKFVSKRPYLLVRNGVCGD